MIRTPALLVVMILAVGPLGSLGCELWCRSPAAADHHSSVGCHDASPTMPLGQQMTSTAGCHDAAAITPFVTEARHTMTPRVTAGSVAFLDCASIRPDTDKLSDGWRIFEAQPPRPPSSRAVLRV